MSTAWKPIVLGQIVVILNRPSPAGAGRFVVKAVQLVVGGIRSLDLLRFLLFISW